MLCVGSVLELEVERNAAGIEPVERGDALFDDIGAVVYRASVLGGDEQIADRLIAVFFGNIALSTLRKPLCIQ